MRPFEASDDDTDRLIALAVRSHRVIIEHQQPGGAYPASPTFSAYRGYAWLRDGAFTAEGISRFGDEASAERFHTWVAEVLARRRPQVDGILADLAQGAEVPLNRMLPTRFTFDGEDGSDPWWDFQTDGYGMWLWSLVEHTRRYPQPLDGWRAGIEVAVDYLCALWDRPCYDWWEEHIEHRHVSTLAAIHGGLQAIASASVLDESRQLRALEVAEASRALALEKGLADGHLTKWLGAETVDASLAACIVPFGLVSLDDPIARATLDRIAADLDADGGVHRFRADVYFGGGQWLLLSALLGWNLARLGDREGALRLLRWIAAQETPEGDLPEQVAGHLLAPASRPEWIERWGTVATPLLWSHGMYLILADELGLLEGVKQ